MKRILMSVTAAAALAAAGSAVAQVKDKPGQSEYAPGQQPGAAKKSAPGQKMHKKDDKTKPGASEYAPGQQGKKTK